MIDERRKELAALSFGEKLKLLEKLRERSMMLAEAREKLPWRESRVGATTATSKFRKTP